MKPRFARTSKAKKKNEKTTENQNSIEFNIEMALPQSMLIKPSVSKSHKKQKRKFTPECPTIRHFFKQKQEKGFSDSKQR